MDAIWTQFRTRLEAALPGCTSRLAPADDASVAQFEFRVGTAFPADFKRYLQLAGGRNDHGPSLPEFGYLSLQSLAEIQADRNMLIFLFRDEPPVNHIQENKLKPRIWDPLWIPFMEFNGTDRLLIDLNPGRNGHFGQVVYDYPGNDWEADSAVRYQSFPKFIEDASDRLRKSLYEIKDGRIVFPDWP